MVYKYYSPQEYNFEVLRDRYFFFSKVSKLNDPFDTKLLLGLNAQYVKSASKMVKEYGTCSFSRRADNKSLWALYAQSYTGFAVGYDETHFGDLVHRYNIRFLFHDVFYVDKPLDCSDPEISFPSWDNDGGKQVIRIRDCPKDRCKMDALFIYMAFMKEAKIWAVEEEYRVFVGQNMMQPGNINMILSFKNGYKVSMQMVLSSRLS